MATVDSNLEWVRLAQRVPVRIHLDEQQGKCVACGYHGDGGDYRRERPGCQPGVDLP